jgi:hypothetical protein
LHLTAAGSATLRLLACMEAFSQAEEDAVRRDDWPELAALLERELAVVTRLAGEQERTPTEDPLALAAAHTLQKRFEALSAQLHDARLAGSKELEVLLSARRRMSAVRGAYRES